MARQDTEKASKSYNRANITLENLHEYFEYHPEGYLVNKKDRGRTAKSGQKTCSESRKSYSQVVINGKPEREHRIIWALHKGRWPTLIDHVDGDKFNNKIENLEEVDHKTNIRRASSKKSGVRFDSRLKRWLSRITVDNKSVHLGVFDTKEEAIVARLEAEKEHWGFYGLSN